MKKLLIISVFLFVFICTFVYSNQTTTKQLRPLQRIETLEKQVLQFQTKIDELEIKIQMLLDHDKATQTEIYIIKRKIFPEKSKEKEDIKSSSKSKREKILRKELYDFFMDIPEVKWVIFDDNTIYVGFETYPDDGNAILRGAALQGNKVINFGCHIWAVHADQKNNKEAEYGTLNGKWFDEVTARHNKFED